MRLIKTFVACLLTLAALPVRSEVLYNGESVPFSSSSGWDANGSTLKQTSTAPFSKANHLRVTLKVKNWWAGAAYVPKAWQPVDLKGRLSMMIKSSSAHELLIQIHDSSKKASDLYKIVVDSTYRKYDIPLCALTGADPSKTTAVVFAVSLKGPATYNVDIDDIEIGGTSPTPTPSSSSSLKSKARSLVEEISGRPYFLTGGTHGSSAGTKSDIHYRYLVGGWRKWNSPDGEYALMVTRDADGMGAIPMFSYYKLAYEFEIKNYAFITGEPLHEYLQDMRVLFQKISSFGKPALLHVEPDFFGYLQQYSVKLAKSPKDIPARVRWDDLPECKDLPDSVDSITRCILKMARTIAPKTGVGFHASHWGDWYDMNDPNAPAQQKSYSVADFLKSMGGDEMDFVVLETSDRDAGYLETARGAKGVYWSDKDRENHLRWVGYITERLQKPVIWWQMPLGVPSTTPGGTSGHYRDNRVVYFYGMIPRLVELGGFGMVFGAGAAEQTTTDTDGGQLKRFNDKYQAGRFEIK